jgi:hypothetical protein
MNRTKLSNVISVITVDHDIACRNVVGKCRRWCTSLTVSNLTLHLKYWESRPYPILFLFDENKEDEMGREDEKCVQNFDCEACRPETTRKTQE